MAIYTFFPDLLEHYEPWVYYKEAFTSEECDKISEIFKTLPDTEALVSGKAVMDLEKREAKLRWLTWSEPYEWLYAKVKHYVLDCNKVRYKYDLTGFLEDIQLTEYTTGGHYQWHQDAGEAQFSRRKLSLVVQLSQPSEYEGGSLQFFPGENEAPKEMGSIILFPSYIVHRVTPITKGVRKSLVAWISGPPYR